jgi:hypothetical protein
MARAIRALPDERTCDCADATGGVLPSPPR